MFLMWRNWWLSWGELTVMYLGLPLGACFKSRASWPFVKERVHKRLAIEKCNIFLREGRRPTLIKSTLSNLPIYHMSLLFPRESPFSFI